jgi:hypothetical protein
VLLGVDAARGEAYTLQSRKDQYEVIW